MDRIRNSLYCVDTDLLDMAKQMYNIPKSWAIEESSIYPDIDVLTGFNVVDYCKDLKEGKMDDVKIENYSKLFFPDPASVVCDLQDMADDVLKDDDEPSSSGLNNVAKLVEYSDSDEEVEDDNVVKLEVKEFTFIPYYTRCITMIALGSFDLGLMS